MEVNFKELKRKELQRLCKKHGLRANATNSQMADSLVSLFKICEKNKQGKVLSKGSRGNGSSIVEGVEGDAEKVIVIDEDEDELGSVLQSADRKSSPQSRRTSKKDEQIEPRLKDSGGFGNGQGTRVKWHEENAIILLDEEHDEPCPVLRSVDRKKSRRLSRKVGKLCDPSRSNEENELVGVLRNPKKDILVPVETRKSRSMNSEVAQCPVIGKKKRRKDRQVARQNAEPPLDASKLEVNEVGTRKENLSVTMAAGDGKVKRKGKSRNSFMKINDEIMVTLPIEVLVTENLVGDVVHEKHANTVMGSDITFSIDGEQTSKGTATRNEQGIEEHVLCTAGNLMKVAAGSVGTQRKKKRTREALEEDSPVMEKEIDKVGFAHHPELLHRDDIVEPEVCFGSSQVLGSPSSSNLASSRPCLLLSESQGGPGVETMQECQDFEEVIGGEVGDKRNKSSKNHEAHKEKENGSECQEGYNDRITGNSDFEKTFPVILRDESKIEDISDITSPANEKSNEMSNSALQSVNRRDDHNFYLAENNSETVGREDSQVVVQGQVKDLKTLVDGRGAASEEKASYELEYLAETLKKPGLDLSRNKFQDQAADYGQAAITPTRKIETDSSGRQDKLKLQELAIFRNLEATMDTWAEEKIDSCHIQLSSTSKTKIVEVEQQSKTSLSSRKEIIDPQNLIVSNIIDVSTIFSDHLFSSEFDGKDAEGTKRSDHRESCSVSPGDIKMLNDCKAHLDAEMGGINFLERNESHGEPIEAGDGEAKEYESNLSAKGSEEKSNAINFKEKFESFQKFPDNQRLAETNSGEFFVPFESLVLQEELYQIKGGGTFKFESNVQITQDNLKHDGEKSCSSEEPQAVGYVEGSEAKDFAGSPLTKMDETAPFGLSKRVDNLMEKLFCLKKVLRGEIAPLITDSSLPCKEEIFCIESHATTKKEMTSGESFSCHEQECQAFNALMPTEPVHEDYELDSSNSEVNIQNKTDEVTIISSPDALQGNPEMWKCMKSCEVNDTDEASPYECDFYVRPVVVEPCQDGDMDDGELLEIVQGGTAKPGKGLEDNEFVPSGKLSSSDLEGERSSSASCFSKKELNNSGTNSPANCINHFGTKCLSETLDAHSSLTSKQAHVKLTVEILKVESRDEVAIPTSSEALQGNLKLWKRMENCEANNTCSHTRPAEAEPSEGDDINAMDFLETTQGATAKSREVLERIRLVSPIKQSRISFESDRNSNANCVSKKTNLNSSITKSPAKDSNHFENHRFSETLFGQNSLPIKEAQAKHTFDVLKMESHEEIANTNSGDALQGKKEVLKCIESCAATNLDAAFPYECDFSYDWQAVGESRPDDDINVREFVKIDQGATTKPGECLEKMKFLSPSKLSSIDLEDERNSSTSCISKKAKLNNNITNSPAKDSKHCGTQCLSKTLDDHSSLPGKQAYANHSVDILEVKSQEGSIPGADTLVDDVSSEVKVSSDSNVIDPVEEIRRKLVNFCVSSSQKAVKSNILNTPITNSAGISSVCLSRNKENTQSTKMKHTSKRKIWNSASAGSIRRPLQSFTNQMI